MAFSHLPRLLLPEKDPTPSPFPSPPVYSRSSFRPSIAVIIAVLAIMFSLTVLLLLYAKHCKRQATSSGGGGGGGGGPSAIDRRDSGVGRHIVESLPVFRFASLTGPHKHGLECAVCLTRFEPHEILRLLPKCKHGFHVECVDIWLEAHSSCPLCRVRVDPEDVLLVLDLKPEPPPPDPATVSDAVVSLPFVRRMSGRHSSAGERGAGRLQVVVHRRSEGGDGIVAAAGASLRKDRMLLTESTSVVERGEFERRYSHRINVVPSDDGHLGGRGGAI